MPIIDPRIVALMLGLAGPHRPIPDLPAVATIATDAAELRDEPGERAFVTGVLRRGERVRVLDVGRDEWLTIEPPDSAFGWVEAADLEEGGGGKTVRVISTRALVRAAHPDARLPGPPWRTLARGTVVRLRKRSPLVVGSRTWQAIEPPPGAVLHVRADEVTWDSMAPPAEARAAFEPPAEPAEGVSSEVVEALERIETSHRAILRGPVSDWKLASIRRRYQELLKGVTDVASGNAIRDRLAQVERQEEVAEAARKIETILERSHRRDAELAQFRRRIEQAERPGERPYEATGLVQASSRTVDGQRVFALIGPEGTTLAYLDLPPGLDPRPLLARRVGVRGIVHYDEQLRSRLISVRDIDPLDLEGEVNHKVTKAQRKTKRRN